MIRGQ